MKKYLPDVIDTNLKTELLKYFIFHCIHSLFELFDMVASLIHCRFYFHHSWLQKKKTNRNDPEFSERQVFANNVNLHCLHSICIFWTHYSVKQPHNNYSNFSDVQPHNNYSNFSDVQTLWIFTVRLKTPICLCVSVKNQQNDCVPSEDSDQTGHPPSLIRVFAVRMQKAWVLSYPLRADSADWADAQAI